MTPHTREGTSRDLVDVSDPMHLLQVTPCRLSDSRFIASRLVDSLRRHLVKGAVHCAIGAAVVSPVSAQFATEVVHYDPGIGASPGYTDPASALGAPSQLTPGPYGGPVDPFDPAYQPSQLVSIGAGGSLEVHFATPIQADPTHPFGIDFLISSGSFFVITNAFDANYNYIGTPATDGSLGSTATGDTRVSVSADGTHFFTLDPNRAPSVAGLYPTDGQGNLGYPVNPALKNSDFAGLTIEGIRAKYAGSAGGAGYSIGWALDSHGNPVKLGQISYVEVDVISGRAQIDAFSSVAVPEPSTYLLLGLALPAAFWTARRQRR